MMKIQTYIIFTIILFSGLFIFEYTHELTHQTIAEYYGYEADIKMSIFHESYTNITYNGEYSKEHEQLQDITDIVGYQIIVFYAIFITTIMLIIIFKEESK